MANLLITESFIQLGILSYCSIKQPRCDPTADIGKPGFFTAFTQAIPQCKQINPTALMLRSAGKLHSLHPSSTWLSSSQQVLLPQG